MSLSRMVVPFKSWHMKWLDAKVVLSDVELQSMEQQSSKSLIVNGAIIACAGWLTFWPGRHQAWAYMSPATGPHMRWLTRMCDEHARQLKGRIEMTVRTDFEAGHRWALMLGFTLETAVMKAYGPFGEDHAMYTRHN